MSTYELSITGMTCASCARHATKALRAVAGVLSAEVDGWQGGRAVVHAENGLDPAALTAAVERAGYRATVVAEHGGEPASPGEAFDLVVVGGGSAAFAAALKTSEMGGRAAIINDWLPMGGTCVNVGCVPSKTMIRAAEAHHRATHHAFAGIEGHSRVTDFAAVTGQTQALVADLRQHKYLDVVAGDPNITLIEGRGRLVSATEVEVGGRRLAAKHILLATGARTFVPDIPGLADVPYLTNETAYALDALPEDLIVLGGRYIALENAQLFARLGSRVTVLQRSNRILPTEAADLTDALTGYLRAEGLTIHTGVTVEAVRKDGPGVVVEAVVDGVRQAIRGSHLFVATGRRGNTEDLGLDALGIETDRQGFLRVDDSLRTAVPTVFGAGDVIGGEMYVYTAAYEGSLAAENAMTGFSLRRDYTALPWVVFTDPQVAGVGLDERQAEAAGIDYDVATLPLDQVPRALAARDTRGFIRLLRNTETDELIGARILAPEGAELLMEVALAIKYGIPVKDLATAFHPYLTLGEGIKLAAITFGKDVSKLSCCAV